MEGYYDNTIFHRLVPGFIIQGGDPTGTGMGGQSIWDEPFPDEFHSRLRYNRRGLVGMANSGKNDNNSQFFITLSSTPELQGKNTLFGRIVGDSIYNVLRMAEIEIDKNERPLYPPKIISTNVVLNPFEDIFPRITEKEKKKQIESLMLSELQNSKNNVKKNKTLLSFQDEEVDDNVSKTFKFKSSHDIGGDSNLSEQPAVITGVKRKQDPSDKIEKKEPSIDSVKKYKSPITNSLNLSSVELPEKKDSSDTKKTKIQEIQEQINVLKKDIRSMGKKKDESLNIEKKGKEKPLSYLEKERERYRTSEKAIIGGRGKSVKGREEKTLAKLLLFQSRISSKDCVEIEEKEEEEKDACELHGISGCFSCFDRLGEHNDLPEENNSDWFAKKLIFAKDKLGKDHTYSAKKAEEDFEIIDPRERKEKAIFEEKMKKKNNEISKSIMNKKHEKEREYLRNNTYSYDRENRTTGHRGERFSVLKGRPSLHQNYSLEKYQRFNSTCPNTIPRGPRHPYVSLYQHGRRRSKYSSFPHSSYFEKCSRLPLYQTRSHSSDFEYSPEQINKNTYELDRHWKNIDENGHKNEFSDHKPHLTPYNASIYKYYNQSFDFISSGSSKMNRISGESTYHKDAPKENELNRKRSFYERNIVKNQSQIEYEKNNNYDLKMPSSENLIVGLEKEIYLGKNKAKKRDIYEFHDSFCNPSLNSSSFLNRDSRKERSMFSENDSVSISTQNNIGSDKSSIFSDYITKNCNNEHNFDDCTFFPSEAQELEKIAVESQRDIDLTQRYQSIDLEDDFKNTSFTYAVKNDTISQNFSAQDDESLTQEDIYNKIQKIDEAILTCQNRLYEIENRKLQTIRLNDEFKKEVFPSAEKSPNFLSTDSFTHLETELFSRIYFENKEKAKQNHVKFSYFKLYNNSFYEYPFFKENELKHENFRPLLFLYISQKNKKIFEKNKILQSQYEKYQTEWESRIEKLDNIKKTKKSENERFKFLDTYLDSLPLRSFRRGQNLNYGDFVRSDADFEDIIAKLGAEDDRISRAAVIPPMVSDLSENVRYQYDDTNRMLRDPISSFHYPAQINIWTAEEHEIFKQLFIKYPQKNFGLIASNIPNKTISQCVLHYYRTKKQENYKNLVMSKNSDRAKRKGKNRSSKKLEKTKISLLAGLHPNMINDDVEDD
ncbi:hypothetical protein PORY_002429 [Pneumocystis oryctolagi]|uniref:Uncharacterized protein n=1 Tax=Pneumocystis oryctolagi TaxID=42067 RepID=A0ACB7CBD8_9ASCO|nr:hypothetical protein PORY_002429 [Pneumocystis oryctolagi]